MIQFPGKDNFDGYFDFFEWSAPVYENIDEIRNCFANLDIFNKEIKDIRVIGCVFYSGIDKIKDRIIENFDTISRNTGNRIYPPDDLDSYQLDNSVLVSEPLVIEFADGSSFELMPMGVESCRMSENTIHHQIVDGMNYSNFSLSKVLFKSCIGRTITSFKVLHDENYEKFGAGDHIHWGDRGNAPAKYRYALELTDIHGKTIQLVITPIDVPFQDDGNFSVSLHSDISGNPDRITVADIAKSRKPVSQLCLTIGISGGTFDIRPFRNEPDNLTKFLSDFCNVITFQEDDFSDWLETVFAKHFDPEIQPCESIWCPGRFDYYGTNTYTYESIRAVLADLRKKAVSLRAGEPLTNEELFKYWDSTDCPSCLDLHQAHNLKDGDQLFRELLADLYERFCRYMESLMRTVKDGSIDVLGV